MKTSTILDENVLYVPIKLFCSKFNLDFSKTMMYFNELKIEVKVHYKDYENDSAGINR